MDVGARAALWLIDLWRSWDAIERARGDVAAALATARAPDDVPVRIDPDAAAFLRAYV